MSYILRKGLVIWGLKKSLLGYINKEIIGNPGMSNFSGMMGSTKEAEIDGKKLEGEET